ncbi:MAG: nucleotidyltransferase domain-containing protein [Aigarchaeota archaeon]|nr:nucleotidyltransferase domain-containing protein [Candidatus Pelearchaeum maunauluense]
MKISEFDAVVESAGRRLAYLNNWREAAGKIREIVMEFYPDARVFVFGSVLSGRITAASDIDLLVIRGEDARRVDSLVRAEAWRRMPYCPAPLHFATEREFSRWYMRFIDKFVEVV